MDDSRGSLPKTLQTQGEVLKAGQEFHWELDQSANPNKRKKFGGKWPDFNNFRPVVSSLDWKNQEMYQ